MSAAFVLPATGGTQFAVERYSNGRGMSFGLEDQHSPSLKPPSPCWGFSLFLWRSCCCRHEVQAIRFKMETPNGLEKYTVKHISEITDRITALRMRWLRHVETQLASQQSRLAPAPARVLDHYEFSTEAAE